MACVLYPSPIFGPVHSRRLGLSLGVNLLPAHGKVCSFDCIYCECGFNGQLGHNTVLPARQEVAGALKRKLAAMAQAGQKPDVLTFAGNGEPTSHPQFAEIIDDTIAIRDEYFPEAKISVLSNATFLKRPKVFDALKRVDNNILKLDTVDPDFIDAVDRPNAGYDVGEIIEKLKAFKGQLIIQTMFLKGEFRGKKLDNTTDEYVEPWIEALKAIDPKEVMIYTIARETPAQALQKASKAELDRIASRLASCGFKVQVSY